MAISAPARDYTDTRSIALILVLMEDDPAQSLAPLREFLAE
jgi:hypothetical protein